MPESEKAQRRAARERVSAYYERELAILIGHVEDAITRHRAGDIDVHDVDALIHQYSNAARKLWGFCWSHGDIGSLRAYSISSATTRAAGGRRQPLVGGLERGESASHEGWGR